MRSKLLIVVLIAASLSIVAWSSQDQTGKTKNVVYEYQLMSDPTAWQGQEEGVKTLNKVGAQGWDITAVVPYGENQRMLYLKRIRQ